MEDTDVLNQDTDVRTVEGKKVEDTEEEMVMDMMNSEEEMVVDTDSIQRKR